MSDSEVEERSGDRRKKSAREGQAVDVGDVFRELFNLLEQYAPTWYTEQHHNRAVAALRLLEKNRQLAEGKAARSHKAS